MKEYFELLKDVYDFKSIWEDMKNTYLDIWDEHTTLGKIIIFPISAICCTFLMLFFIIFLPFFCLMSVKEKQIENFFKSLSNMFFKQK